jgi:TetR/AcrR family transcriptional regulator, mexCD-oprJ operon repressor
MAWKGSPQIAPDAADDGPRKAPWGLSRRLPHTLGNPTMSGAAPEPTPLPRRKALQQRVSTAILNAAARTLATHGDRANLADVAEEAGVARATVYRYYPNRTRLVEELVRRATQSIHERLLAARVDKLPAEEGITRTVRAFVDEGDAFVVLVSERRHSERSEFDRLVLPPIRRLLEIGRAQGQIRSDIQTVVLVEALLSFAAGVLRNCSLGRDDLVATISTVFLDGALAPPRPDVPRLQRARRARRRDQGERDEP